MESSGKYQDAIDILNSAEKAIGINSALSIRKHYLYLKLKNEKQALKELEIAKAQILAEGKPENMVEKIAQGKLQKFYKENTLLHQAFVKDNSKSITQYLDSVAKGLTVAEFRRITIG